MYTGKHAHLRPLQPAFIMANSGETVTYAELDARSNRLAHLFRKHGLKRLDHYAIFMENNSRYLEACGAGERIGLYFTCVNSYLTGSELAYIVDNSESRILITSVANLRWPGRPSSYVRRSSSVSLSMGRARANALSACSKQRGIAQDADCGRVSAPRCSIRRAQPGGRKASCGRWPRTRRHSKCRCSISCKSSGSTAKA